MNSHLHALIYTHGNLNHNSHKVIFSAIYKNFYIFYSATNLTKQGLYGSARVLLRQSFEFLILGKFCAITKNDKVFNNWENGETVYFTKEVLKKINNPNMNDIQDLWILLCKYAHSTNMSQQVGINWDSDKDNIHLTFGFIQILIEFHYHLFNSILLTNTVKSFVSYYDKDDKIKKYRKDINAIFKLNKTFYTPRSKKLIRDYKSTWTINS